MVDKAASQLPVSASGAAGASAASVAAPPAPPRNPAFQAMGIVLIPRTGNGFLDAKFCIGLPNIRARLPSRNWLIFLSITGSFFSLLSYDRYQKRRAQRKWSALVSSAAADALPTKMMPRKITVYLSAPPGDNLRPVREHFKEYVKPILVAGGLDWEVVEGRKEGELRAGLAERVRKLREKSGEKAPPREEEDTREKGIQLVRDSIGIKDWSGVKGDLVLGRHAWKEYIRGLHEGWLGPMEPPQRPVYANPTLDDQSLASPTPGTASLPSSSSASEDQSSSSTTVPDDEKSIDTPSKPSKPEPPKDSSPTASYILPDTYNEAPLPSTPVVIPPSTILPFPHLLGFFNTPIRTYRFLTRRRLANETGRQVAAIILAARTTSFEDTQGDVLPMAPFDESTDSQKQSSTLNPEMTSPATALLIPKTATSKILSEILMFEEKDWHKSAYAPGPAPKPNPSDNPCIDPASPVSSTSNTSPLNLPSLPTPPDRPWRDPVITDPRIEALMTTFLLPPEAEKRAQMALEAQDKKRAEERWARLHKWLGWRQNDEERRKGWEMGWEGNEDS